MSFFRIFGLYLSGFVLVCISLDRYFAVMKPLGIPDAQKRAMFMLRCAWVVSIICSLPQVHENFQKSWRNNDLLIKNHLYFKPFVFHVESHPDFSWYKQCVTFNSFASPLAELAYNLFGFFFLYVFPMLMIIFCYSSILLEMHRVARLQNGKQNGKKPASFLNK